MRIQSSQSYRAALPAVASILLATGQALASGTPTPIALTGTSGPLGPGQGAATFTNLGSAIPSINNAGQVIFRADSTVTTGAVGVGATGLWLHSAGANAHTGVTAGTPAPGGGNYTNSGINNPILNDSGAYGYRDGSISSGASNLGASLYASSGSQVVMKRDASAPGTGTTTDATFASVANPSPFFNGAGHTAFVATLTGGSPAVVTTGVNANASSLWSGFPGSASLRVRQNDVYPDGSVVDVRLGAINANMQFNDAGTVLFHAALQGTVSSATATANNHAVFKHAMGGPLSVVARRGDAAPGTVGEFYANISNTGMAMNNAGRVAFSSSVRNAAGTATSAGSLFSDTTGSLTIVARGGAAMPAITGAVGTEFDGVNWGAFFSDSVINNSGTVAFKNSGMTGTGITSANSTAILKLDSSGTFTKVMRLGDVVPGESAPGGGPMTFTSMQGGLALNALGQTAFFTLVSGSGLVGGLPGEHNNRALFAADEFGSICLVARTGTQLEVAPGDFRTIVDFGGVMTTGNQDGRSSMLNDNGDLVYTLNFNDGSSGVFMMHIPAPGAASLLGLAGLLVSRRRR